MDEHPDAAAAPDEGRRELLRWAWRLPVLLTLAGAGVGGYAAWRIHFSKERPSATPVFDPGEPQPVAELSALAEPWSAAAFSYLGVPAFALRLPEPVAGGVTVDGAHLIAFSRVCTHQGCPVTWNTNPEAIAVATNHRTDRPQLFCSCHLSVFDPLRAGLVVSGPAVRPLPRIALEARGGTLWAVGIERGDEG